MYLQVDAMTSRRLFSPPLLSAILALSVLAADAAAAPADTARSRESDTRVLRSGDRSLRIQVLGPVDKARSDELQRWLAEVADASLAAFGRFPLSDATVRVEQSPSRARSPVPWGQTMRRDGVAVLLYVREDASFDELRADWTAVHELSHLFHPYLGGDGRWLAEGLASYYQNVLRARVGLLDEDQAWRLLHAGFGRGRNETSELPLSELSRRHRGTMRVYWAGAAYWLEADLALRRDGSSLDAVLAQYASCCLRGTGEVAPAKFVAQLDTIAKSEVFTRLFRRYVDSIAFPPLDSAYAALGIDAGQGGVQFSNRPDAARLRHAVMGRRKAR
jgi:hypothetical protein